MKTVKRRDLEMVKQCAGIWVYQYFMPEAKIGKKVLCCFHNETRPSLSFYEDKRTGEVKCKCFGCGKGSDIVDFIKSYANVSTREAIEMLQDIVKAESSLKNTPRRQKSRYYSYVDIKRSIKDSNQIFEFDRMHCDDAANPPYLKAIYKSSSGDKTARFYTEVEGGKFIMSRLSEPVLYNQKSLNERPKDQVIYVEGEKDVDSLTKLGFLAVTAGSVNDFKDSMIKNFKGRTVVLIPDYDKPGIKSMEKIGRLIYQVAGSVKWIDISEIWQQRFNAPPEKGADITDLCNKLREGIKHDEETIQCIREAVLDLLNTARDFKPTETMSEPQNSPLTDQYYEKNGSLYHWKVTKEGKIPVKLFIFTAIISEEIIEDNGVDSTRKYLITGRQGDTMLDTIEVSASSFVSMNWIHQWGSGVIIEPGHSKKDKVRHAIQVMSLSKTRRTYCYAITRGPNPK